MTEVVRVYNSGRRVTVHRTPDELQSCIDYNTTMRFGCALFVDGRCVHHGYLEPLRCQEIEQELLATRESPQPTGEPSHEAR